MLRAESGWPPASIVSVDDPASVPLSQQFCSSDLLIMASVPAGTQLAGMKTRLGQWLLYRLGLYEKITALIAQSLDRKLSLQKRMMLRLYMGLCSCYPHLRKELTAMKQILRSQPSDIENLDAEHLSAETRERIKRMLKQARYERENGKGSDDR
jgi:hypothetical protein